jgi:hypothetical protein
MDVLHGGVRARRFLLASAAALVLSATAAAAPKPPRALPNDPGWPGQWGLRSMHVPQVWPLVAANAHPVVATVDTGVDAAFPDLRNAVVAGWNVVDDDGDTADTAEHGTDVALVIAANANNGYGIAGACPMCRVMPVKVSLDRTASPATVAAGIRWAVDHGARIVVVSIVHTGAADPAEQPAVAYAVEHGAVVIASAGNDSGTEPHYPAALPGAIAVTATDTADRLYPWATHGSWVALAAPGCEYTTEMCGASYAPPLVAAAVGLLVAAGGVTPVQAMEALRATARPVDGIAGGRIDVLAAATALGIRPPATPTPHRDLQRGTFGQTLVKKVVTAAGPLSIVVTRAGARTCTMTLRTRNALYLGSETTADTLSLAAHVSGGVHVLVVTCAGTRQRPYSVLVTALRRPPS